MGKKKLDQQKIAAILGSEIVGSVGAGGPAAAYFRHKGKPSKLGQWELAEGAGGGLRIFPVGGEEAIARIVMDDGPDAARQRGTLMAAAPDLLAALRFCRSVIEANTPVELSEKKAIAKADAAIAKATGGNPGE